MECNGIHDGNYKIVKIVRKDWKIDKCIADEVKDLIDNYGIKTYGSCCGHGSRKPVMLIDPKSVYECLRLGYEIVLSENANNLPAIKLKSRLYG